MTSFILQLLAMITMTIDHVGQLFCGDNVVMRTIGRIAFPLYAFLLAEGFSHYKDKPDRIKARITKFIVLTVISEFCYDFMEEGRFVEWDSQCAMFTLFLGLIGLIITERFRDRPLLVYLYYAASSAITFFCRMNFRVTGVLLIYAFYYFTNHTKGMSYLKKLGILLVMITVYYYFYTWARVDFASQAAWNENFAKYWPWLLGHYAAMAIIAAYNGERGWKNKAFSALYSIYYPLHMFILGLIQVLGQ